MERDECTSVFEAQLRSARARLAWRIQLERTMREADTATVEELNEMMAVLEQVFDEAVSEMESAFEMAQADDRVQEQLIAEIETAEAEFSDAVNMSQRVREKAAVKRRREARQDRRLLVEAEKAARDTETLLQELHEKEQQLAGPRQQQQRQQQQQQQQQQTPPAPSALAPLSQLANQRSPRGSEDRAEEGVGQAQASQSIAAGHEAAVAAAAPTPSPGSSRCARASGEATPQAGMEAVKAEREAPTVAAEETRPAVASAADWRRRTGAGATGEDSQEICASNLADSELQTLKRQVEAAAHPSFLGVRWKRLKRIGDVSQVWRGRWRLRLNERARRLCARQLGGLRHRRHRRQELLMRCERWRVKDWRPGRRRGREWRGRRRRRCFDIDDEQTFDFVT
jgi:hypothetical protein